MTNKSRHATQMWQERQLQRDRPKKDIAANFKGIGHIPRERPSLPHNSKNGYICITTTVRQLVLRSIISTLCIVNGVQRCRSCLLSVGPVHGRRHGAYAVARFPDSSIRTEDSRYSNVR